MKSWQIWEIIIMVDISQSLLAKSDQLNAADLIDPIAIQIDKVNYDPDRVQPLWIYYNKLENPWKPSKGMRKIIASDAILGLETDNWTGARLRIFRESSVKYAGKAVGGVEISEFDGITSKKSFPVRTAKMGTKAIDINPLVLSEKEITFFENLYGAGDENINSTNSTVNVKEEPETPLYLDATQIDIIQKLLYTANWEVGAFCATMEVNALSEIGAVKFDNLRIRINEIIATQYKENT